MDHDTTNSLDPLTSNLSRRRLLAAVAGLSIATLLPRGSMAARAQESANSGLRDFAFVCAELMLAMRDRDDLRAFADLQRSQGLLALTPQTAFGQGQASSVEQAERIFAAGARQWYSYMAENADASRGLVVNIVDGSAQAAAEYLQIVREATNPNPEDLITPDLAAGADEAFLFAARGYETGHDPSQEYNWLTCGLRFGSTAVAWQVGIRTEVPPVALAGTINRLLRDYLIDPMTSTHRGASLAFLLTIPPARSFILYQTVLDGTVLGTPYMDEVAIAARQAQVERAGIRNELATIFFGPGKVIGTAIIEELASAEQAKEQFATLQREATDPARGVTQRPFTGDAFSSGKWDAWAADVESRGFADTVLQEISVRAAIDSFIVAVELGDGLPAGTSLTALPGNDHPLVQSWAAMAQTLLAPIPSAARRIPDLAARAYFPEPVTEFVDPLAADLSQG